MRKLLAAATALGLLAASLPASAAETGSKPAKIVVAKAKVTKVRHATKRSHHKRYVRHHRHPRMAASKAHRKHVVFNKKHHQVRKATKPAARNS